MKGEEGGKGSEGLYDAVFSLEITNQVVQMCKLP